MSRFIFDDQVQNDYRRWTFNNTSTYTIIMSSQRTGSKKSILPPINLIFKYLQQQALVSIWLYEQTHMRIEGRIRGFDEFMNLVIDDAVEISTKNPNARQELGRILLKGDNITLISSTEI